MTTFTCTYDSPPDTAGRRSFTLTWEEPEGVFRRELSLDGAPVGHRRGQCFRAHPEECFAALRSRGHDVLVREAAR